MISILLNVLLFFRNGGTEAATFCALTTLCKQLESYNAIDCYQVAKLYHDKRPGIWRSPVRMHERYCSSKNRFISMKSFQVFLSLLLSWLWKIIEHLLFFLAFKVIFHTRFNNTAGLVLDSSG